MATCNDCVHSGICAIQLEPHYVLDRAQKLMRESNNVEHECLSFKDRSRFIELPCKIGNKVFSLVGKGEIEKWTVTDIYFSDFGVADINILQIKVRSEDKDKGASFPSYYLGRSFFYTYEEAEQALKERE